MLSKVHFSDNMLFFHPWHDHCPDMTMTSDKCRFDTLFQKMETKLPPSVTRGLIFVYHRQYAWARWGNKKSSELFNRNSTRQGSVLSPALFTVYVKELQDKLKTMSTGWHIRATFLGAVAWADNFLLTAPTRGAMQSMLDVCSSSAAEVGLQFITDPNPARSKSKAELERRHDCCSVARLFLM